MRNQKERERETTMIKDRIKELREKNGLTISAFAKSLGISPTSASLYERWKQNPGKKTIAKICEVYGVEEGYLLSAPTDKTTPIDKDTTADKATSTAKEDDGAVEDTPADKAVEEKKRGRRPKKKDVVNEEKEPDIATILARVAEIGVRKAAAEAGVAWQTVNKWKKDAEKAAAALPAPEDIGKSVGEIIEAAGEISDGIQKTLDTLTTPEGAQEAVTKVMEMVTTSSTPAEPAEVKETAAPAEEKKDQIDISAVLARVAEIGVRKAAAEIGVAWQTVSKWKKDAEKAATPAASTKEEKKEEKKPEEKKTKIIIQSPMGGNITPRQVLQKIPDGSDSVYIRVDENKLYWVKGDENGAVDIWG